MSAPKPSILEQGLAHAQSIALLPDDADIAVIGVKEGDVYRAGLVTRFNDRWSLAADLGINTTTKDVGARVVLIGKGKR